MSLSGFARAKREFTGLLYLSLLGALACSPSAGKPGPEGRGGQGADSPMGGGGGGGNDTSGGGVSGNAGASTGNVANAANGGGGDQGTGSAGGNSATGGVAGNGAGGTVTPMPTEDWAEPAGTNDVQAGGVGARLAALQCEAQAHCCDHSHSDKGSCQNTLAATYASFDYATTKDAFNAAQAKAVLNEFEKRAMNCDPTITKWAASLTPANGAPAGLRTMVDGVNAANGSCSPLLNPIPGHDAQNLNEAAAAIASCQNPVQNACLPHPDSLGVIKWSCAGVGSGGCFTDANCAENQYCTNPPDNPQVNDDGTCQPRAASGTPCTFGNWCDSFLCNKATGMCADVGDGPAVDVAYCLN